MSVNMGTYTEPKQLPREVKVVSNTGAFKMREKPNKSIQRTATKGKDRNALKTEQIGNKGSGKNNRVAGDRRRRGMNKNAN